MTVAGKTYEDRKEAGEAIISMCKEMKTANVPVGIGEYLGMKMAATFDSFSRKFTLSLKGNLSHTIGVGSDSCVSGVATRFLFLYLTPCQNTYIIYFDTESE